MKEIKAKAPTPQDWIELVRENERLTKKLKLAEQCLETIGDFYRHEVEKMESEAGD